MRHCKYICVLLLGIGIMLSCYRTESVKRYSSFDEIVTLVSKKDTISNLLLYPRNLFICNHLLVVLNEKTDTLFQVFRLPDFRYEYSFGIKGDGPEDFNMPAINAVSYDENGFTLLDVNKLKHINIVGDIPVVRNEALPFNFSYFNGMVKLSDSLYCCNAGFEEDREFMFLRFGDEPKLWGEYPESAERFKGKLARNQAYDKITVVKPDGEKFVSFYRFIRRYKIYNSAGALLNDAVVDVEPGNYEPDLKEENNYIHTISAFASENYIYTLNLDMTPQEIMAKEIMPNIQVFTWDGLPVKQYHLDRFISSFVVDEKEGKIYGVFVDDMDGIYTFKMQ